jgi:catechol 2,3-dioxygenase-like lactoylglutathione lyase family enzyme
MIESVSAVTLATHNMPRAVAFYRMLGFEIVHGGDDAAFTSFRAGTSFLNLVAQPAERKWSWWGRVIFYHSDVDTLYAGVIAAGYRPDTAPRDGHVRLSLETHHHRMDAKKTARLPSRPWEFHPEPLTDPYVNLSIHTARATARRLPPSV